MKSRIGWCAVGLLALVGATGCGEGYEVPENNAVVVPGISRAGKPTDVVATPGDAQVSLTWKAPEDTGDTRLLGYTVWIFEEGKLGRTQALKSTETSATIKDLTNGTPYSFMVAATNPLGDGPQSVRSETVTPQAAAANP